MDKQKRGALQISFAWIFAILVGAFILFLAIFAVTKFIGIEKTKQDVETGKEIGVLLNPLEISFETGKVTLLSNSVNTRIYGGCGLSGTFGKQTIKVSQEMHKKWSETHTSVPFPNKYIFSENPVEGKNFYIFSKAFEFPFKVADLIYIISSEDKYCFIDTPDDIEDEISDLKGEKLLDNIYLKDCPSGSIRVCFRGGSKCDVKVNYDERGKKGFVEKDGKQVYFMGDALMYAGIFSDKETYECQLKRLMQRTEQLSLLYKDKADFLFEKTGCVSDLKLELFKLSNFAGGIGSSEDSEFFVLSSLAEKIQLENDNGECRLW